MSHFGATIGPVTYDPETQSFRALVTLHEGTDHVRIPVALTMPIDSDESRVVPALIRQAREKRAMRRVPLMSRLRGANGAMGQPHAA